MANFASQLKEEIARISRKEARKLVEPLKKQVTTQRRVIAALKTERTELKREIGALGRAAKRGTAVSEPADGGSKSRFSAAGLAKLRSRLALSAEEFGRLIGVSGQSVYNWEQGKARPRQAQVEKIAALRGVGKREARAQADSARETAARSPAKARRKTTSAKGRRKAAPAKSRRARKSAA